MALLMKVCYMRPFVDFRFILGWRLPNFNSPYRYFEYSVITTKTSHITKPAMPIL
jgi:hypothetical protein